jgi:hypothetical protein
MQNDENSIIENQPDMSEILVKILDLMGFTAIASRTGKEGGGEGCGRETRSDRDGHHDAQKSLDGRRLESCVAIRNHGYTGPRSNSIILAVRSSEMHHCWM